MTSLKDISVLFLTFVLTGSQVGDIHFLIKKKKSLVPEMLIHLWGRDCSQEFNISMEKQLCGNFRYRVDYIYKDASKFAISSSITETSKKLKKKRENGEQTTAANLEARK